MNMKKIIPLSFAALSVAGTLSACSDSSVSGADVQGNSIALSSSSGVEPGSSNSYNGLRKETVNFLARVKSHSPNIPVAFVSYGGTSVEDSVNAYATFNTFVDSILNMGTYKLDDDAGMEDVVLFFSGGLRSENGTAYGPIHMFDLSSFKSLFCGYPGELVFSLEDGTHKIYASSETYETHINNYAKTIDRDFLVYDSSLIQRFKEDCLAENGLFTHRPYSTKSVSVDDSVLFVHQDSIYTCQTSISSAGDAAIYTDTFWKKYVPLIFDRCVVDLDSLDYDYFGKAEDSEESEQ